MSKKMINSVLTTVETTVGGVERDVDTMLEPVRKSVLTRFPTIFLLLTTFGVVATFLAFERILMEIQYMYDRPFLMLLVGVGTLILTGTLYKKLG